MGFVITINPDHAKGRNALISDLTKSVRDFGYIASPENPIFVPHTSFNLQTAKNSPHGFKLKIKNGETLVNAPVYGVDNNIKWFNHYDDDNAVPIPTESGSNKIYSVPGSPNVFQVFSSYVQSADADCDVLSYSINSGRVVVGNAVSQNYTKTLKQIE